MMEWGPYEGHMNLCCDACSSVITDLVFYNYAVRIGVVALHMFVVK